MNIMFCVPLSLLQTSFGSLVCLCLSKLGFLGTFFPSWPPWLILWPHCRNWCGQQDWFSFVFSFLVVRLKTPGGKNCFFSVTFIRRTLFSFKNNKNLSLNLGIRIPSLLTWVAWNMKLTKLHQISEANNHTFGKRSFYTTCVLSEWFN